MKNNIVILGGGVSGVNSAVLAKKKNKNVFLSEKYKIKSKYKKILIKQKIDFEELGHNNIKKIMKANEIIKSPGISNESNIIRRIKKNKIKIISEIEFALRYNKYKIIAITGSNGKTTTSTIIYNILKLNNIKTVLCGNIGTTLSEIILKKNIYIEYCILELSSFQLDYLNNFNPKISIITNIYQTHLNRYSNNIKKYIKSKLNICINQSKKNFFIYNHDNKQIDIKNIKAKKISFSIKSQSCDAYIKNNNIFINHQKILNIKNIYLKEVHNIYNILASLLTINIIKKDMNKKIIYNFLSSFKGLEHRIEYVTTIKNIAFINDSKSTNIISTYYALKSIKKPIIWLAGGLDQGNDYNQNIINYIHKKVKSIILLGNNNIIFNIFKNIIDPIIQANNMKEAVESAYMLSRSGDTILLSPGCSSVNLFKNYQDRGNQFKKEVKKLSI